MEQDDVRSEGESPERPLAVAATDKPLAVALKPLEDDRAPEGMACLGSYLGPRLVARCVVPPEAAAFLLERGLFERPVRLALAAREAPPGLQCQLYALVEIHDGLFEEGDEEPEPPWASSVPGAGYEAAAAAAEPDDGEERQAAVFLGQIIRFDRDRKHPGDLARETMDVLRTIVEGEVSEVVDRLLEDLLGGGEG